MRAVVVIRQAMAIEVAGSVCGRSLMVNIEVTYETKGSAAPTHAQCGISKHGE